MGALDVPAERLNHRPGCRFAFLGDSLVAGGVDEAANTRGWSWPTALGLVSGGIIRPVLVDGFPGKRTDEILTHIADITSADANAAVVAGGTNDLLQSRTIASITANLTSMATLVRAARKQPVMVTVPPNDDTSLHTPIAKLNGWIKRYAAQNGIPVLDFHALLTDPTTGTYKSAYASDGVHPNADGYLAMANLAWSVLGPMVPTVPPILPWKNADPNNLLNVGNVLMLTDAGADGTPDGWTRYGGGSGFTNSLVTGDTAISGNWAQIAASGSSADQVLEYNVTGGFTAGDRIMVTGRVGVSGYSSGNGVTVKVQFTGPNNAVYPVYRYRSTASGVFFQELTVPVGTTAILFDFIVHAGTVTGKLAQPAIYNITTSGWV